MGLTPSTIGKVSVLQTINVTRLSRACENAVCRVEAQVEGSSLWFESSDTLLRPAPEAFASALLVPALQHNADLVIDAPLDKTWLSNAHELMTVLGKWWGYRPITISSKEGNSGSAEQRTATGLCFSGGVDSFYNLLRGQYRVDHLVVAHGYDIRLRDTERMDSFRPSLRSIAKATGTTLAVVRTNLREHPVFSGVSWEHAHGGALAALGHVIAGIRRLVISASYPYKLNRPWGSHWTTDPLWSSEQLEIVHEGASLWRSDKLRRIADEPLVREHLRVCWENRTSSLNCCRCEKCLRTMLILAQCGKLVAFLAFQDKTNLAERLDELHAISGDLMRVYRSFLGKGLDAELSRSLRSLLRRSRANAAKRRSGVGRVKTGLRRCVPAPIRRKIKAVLRL
jgi:hypothetical protein